MILSCAITLWRYTSDENVSILYKENENENILLEPTLKNPTTSSIKEEKNYIEGEFEDIDENDDRKV